MSNNPYRDQRQKFWQTEFENALSYEEYLTQSSEQYASLWRNFERSLPQLLPDQKRALNGHNRRLNVLISSGVWCGDCVRQGPMLKRIADQVGDDIDLRIVERGSSPALLEELRILGALRVPVVVFLSEDFFEIGRFGDRLLTVYRSKAQRELGPACCSGVVVPPDDEFRAEMSEWVEIFERMLIMARLSPPLRQRYND